MKDSRITMRNGVGQLALRPIQALQREANLLGHGNATFGAFVGGGLGAMVGSFWGPGGVLIGAALVGVAGFAIGHEFD